MKEENIYGPNFDKLNPLSNSAHVDPFVVPSGFFEEQEESIQNLIKLEHKISKTTTEGLTVPEYYFEGLENNILSRIKEKNFEEKLNSSIGSPGFAVPDEYFNELEDSITIRIKEQKLKEIITTDGFATPAHYFERLKEEVNEKIQQSLKQKTPIVPLSKKRISWVKFSTAALILLVGIGALLSYLELENSFQLIKKSTVSTAVNLRSISDDDLVNYLTQVADNADELMHLTQIVENQIGHPLHLEAEMSRDEDIEEYLKYML